MVYEALEKLRLQAFEKTLTIGEKALLESISQIMQDHSERDKFFEINTSDNVKEVKALYDMFVKKRSEESPVFSLWCSYIKMVQLLLLYIRATKTTDWLLHLSSLKSMIPWFSPPIA